jgi:hypothetical protein
MFKLKRPCKNCPFRSDIEPFITPGRAVEIAESIVRGDSFFPCHKTIDYSTEECDENGTPLPYKLQQENNFCAGALILYEKCGSGANRNMRIGQLFGLYDPKKLDMTSPVYESIEAMVDSHKKASW